MKSFSELTSASQVNNADLLAISQTSGLRSGVSLAERAALLPTWLPGGFHIRRARRGRMACIWSPGAELSEPSILRGENSYCSMS
jgi:hypothetical protein